jgi:long-chain acyl-CoA synthetase
VPRFYEKLWEQIGANRIGKLWLSAKEGPGKKALASLLRRAVLKKAGIDRCSQLIVGSAPVSEALLLRFRALGIEIHNAYGQTEAPLITINRVGDNRIPGIGTPLPETTVTAEADGELIVRGPQVALGYYGLETDTIRDGVLRTGDLGTIREDGHITLHGRKKDFIVTAYGKNISIPKIEERLKDIPGISEAVLIGEERPYCTALLWQEAEIPDLELRIEALNRSLSHPEQIRRYRLIERPLSIGAGELTPNLKVKRGAVEEHFREIIEEMYR